MSTVRRRSVSPSSSSSSQEEDGKEGMNVSENSRDVRRPRKQEQANDDNDPSYDDDDDEVDESYSEYDNDDEEGPYEEDDHHGGERFYYEDDEHGNRRHYQHNQDDDDVERERYNRRAEYEREDSMDVDDILLSNELFPITEMSLSSNATAAGGGGAAGGGSSSGGVGASASIVGGGGSSSGGSAGGGGAIPSGSMVSNMTSASTLNSSVVAPQSPLFRRTGSSRQSLGTTYSGPADPNDSYYADEDYHDNNNNNNNNNTADGDLHHRHAMAAEVEIDDDDEEGDTTLHGTVTEDGDDDDDDDDDDQPSVSVSQYTEHTYATAATTSTAGSPSQRSRNSHDDDVEEFEEEEEEEDVVETSRNGPQRTSSARSASQRSGQSRSRSRRSRASSSSAVSTSHNTTTTTTSSASATSSRSGSRSSSASSSRSHSSASSSRSGSRRSNEDDDYDDDGEAHSGRDGSHSMEEDFADDDENDHRRGERDESSQQSLSQRHSQHSGSGSHSRGRRSEGSYEHSQGSYSRDGSRQSGDGSYGSEGGGDPSRHSSEGSSYRSRMDEDDSRQVHDREDSYRSHSRSDRSRSSRSSSRRSSHHDSCGSNLPDGSARSHDEEEDHGDADRSDSRRSSSSRGSAMSSRHPSDNDDEVVDASARSNLSHRSSSHRSTSYRSSASRQSQESYASGSRASGSAGDGSSGRSRGEGSSNRSRSDRSDSNRGSLSFDGEGSYSENDNSGYPPDESEHDGAILSQKRTRDHNQHPPQTDQGYVSAESHVTPQRTNVVETTPSDESENGLDDGDSDSDGDREEMPNNHMITDEAIMEALQESGLAGIEGVVVEVGDDGVVRISSSHHEEDDDEFDSHDDDDNGEGHRINDGKENVSEEGYSKRASGDRINDKHGEDTSSQRVTPADARNQDPEESMDISAIAAYDEMLAASAPASPDRSRGGNSSGPGSPIATTAMSGSVMSEAGWTSVTSDTNLSNDDGGNSSSDEDEMGPKLPRDPYDDRSDARDSGDGGLENESQSNAEEDGSYGEFGERSPGALDYHDDMSHSQSQPSHRSQTSTGESDHDSKSNSHRSGSRSESAFSASHSHSSGTGHHSTMGRSLDDSRSGKSHSHSADENNSHSGTPSYTESAASGSRPSEAYDSPLNDYQRRDTEPAAETLESAQGSAALSESQSFSELDDPTRLNKARARLLAAYASSGYEDTSSPEQRSAKSFDRTVSESSKLKSGKADSGYDDGNIDALVIAVAAGAAAAAEAAPEEDEVFVDKVDVWNAAVDDKKAEFETSQRDSSTSQKDPSYRSQSSRQSYFENEINDPLEEPSNSYRDGYDMDIEEPIYREDTFYEEKIPRQGYGRPSSYQETLAYAGSYPVVGSEQTYGDSYYAYGDKPPEKLEASPSGLIPTLSLDTGEDDDDDDEDDDADTGAAQDLEAPGKAKIVLAAKSDELDAPVSAFSKRDVRRMVFAVLVTALLMLCIFLPVLLTRRSGTAPVPTPTPSKPTFAPTLSPSLSPKPQYVITGGPFDGTIGSGFGASVAMGSDFAVIGSPFLSSATSFVYSNLDWGLGTNLTGQSDSQFGAALAVAGSGLLIGAPEALDVSLASRTGAAYVFERNSAGENWSIVGSALPGYSVTLDAGDRFGETVAASLNDRVAIGAPGNEGKVYVFQFTQTSSGSYDWLQMSKSPLAGLSTSGHFGTSVDISADGFHVVGGAPNDGAGSALVYFFSSDTSSWELVFQVTGTSDGELFGSSVRFLSPSGDYLAVGGPGGNDGGGLIRVYTSTPGSYQQLGADITGEEGQALGALGSLAGNQSGSGLFLLAGTEQGTILRFDFASSSQSWIEQFAAVTTSENSRVTSLSTSGTDAFIVGQADVAIASIFSVDVVPSVAPVSPHAPTLSPIAASAAPALSPTSPPPTSADSSFVLIAGPFVGSSGSTLGKSVALSDSVMAAGDTSGTGTVQTFQYNSETWQELAFIQGSETGSLFGFSVDVTPFNASLVVGAPSTLKNGTSTAVGSAFFYAFDVASSSWMQVGSQLRGEEDIFAANEAFGASVAASDNGQIVVAGAPFSSELNIVRGGRVYAFEFNSGLGDWTPRQAASLTGDQAETNLGTSIDLSSDGSILVAGGPGRNSDTGYAVVYAWDGYRYSVVSTLEGENAGERFGSCVRLLSGDATYLAVGAPAYNSGQGIIRIFQRRDDGSYSISEPSIVGLVGDGLGARGSLASGGVDPSTSVVAVLAATSSGMLRKYVFDPQSASWDDGTSLSTGMTSSPALASSPGGKNVVVGGSNQATIYSTL